MSLYEYIGLYTYFNTLYCLLSLYQFDYRDQIMKITQEHALFYASKKSQLFKASICIHRLINSQLQVENRESLADKHNDLNYLKLVYNRCKRNDINFKNELDCYEFGYNIMKKYWTTILNFLNYLLYH